MLLNDNMNRLVTAKYTVVEMTLATHSCPVSDYSHPDGHIPITYDIVPLNHLISNNRIYDYSE